jgi:hypothetical protein
MQDVVYSRTGWKTRVADRRDATSSKPHEMQTDSANCETVTASVLAVGVLIGRRGILAVLFISAVLFGVMTELISAFAWRCRDVAVLSILTEVPFVMNNRYSLSLRSIPVCRF